MACCTSLALIQGYFYVFDSQLTDCVLRESVGDHLQFWSVWTWTTEMTVFLAVPVIILVFNVLVILEVRKVSRLGKTTLVPTTSSVKTGEANGSASATTAMLLSVSFYVIFTTLPATLVYVLMADVQEGDHGVVAAGEVAGDPKWTKYLNYILVRKIVDEVCLSHYACNFVLYVITGAQFRRSLLGLLGCSVRRGGLYSEVTQKTDAANAKTTHF